MASFEAGELDFDVTGLPLGSWTVQIRAWDEAGNRGDAALDSLWFPWPPWIALLALSMATSARPGIHDWMHALAEMKRNLRGPFFQAPLRRNPPQRCNTFRCRSIFVVDPLSSSLQVA